MKWLIGGLVMLMMGMAMLLQSPVAAFAGEEPLIHRGFITSRPEGNTGTWVIGDRSFVANASTQFDTTEGPLTVGACAKVRYVVSNNVDVAAEIDSEPVGDCNTNGTGTPTPSGTPSETPSASPSPTSTATLKLFRGHIVSRPEGNIGTWVINDHTFVSNANTEFDTAEGPLTVGACVKVRYMTIEGVDVIDELDSEPADDCNHNGTVTPTPPPSGTPDPSRTPSPTETAVLRGIINDRPSTGKVGTWVIGGQTFTANESTELNEEEGGLSIGSCAKVRYTTVEGVNVAKEIESQSGDDCGVSGTPVPPPPRDSREDSKVFAKVDSLPAAPYTGTWSIGGIEYVANSETEFKQEDGSFAVGVCVKAEFVRINDVNVLKEIETEDAYKCEEGAPGNRTNNFKAYGVIDVFTTTVPSEWVVSGITYTVNAGTQLQQEHGGFVLGGFVEVKYVVSGTVRTATMIKTHVAPGKGLENRVGSLTSRPSDDWGTWVINGVSYQGDPAIVVELPPTAQARAASANAANAAPLIVHVNSYVSNGVNYATLIRGLGNTIYMPVLQR